MSLVLEASKLSNSSCKNSSKDSEMLSIIRRGQIYNNMT